MKIKQNSVMNPVNGALRFVLEVIALLVYALWGFTASGFSPRFIPGIGLPLLFALIWGVFAVRDDPSRSGKTVVRTPGWIRLIIELGLFGFTSWMLVDLEHYTVAGIFTVFLLAHYLTSMDRIRWLIKQK